MNKQSPQGFNPLRGLATVLCFFAIFLVATHFFWNTEDSPQYSYADIRALFEAEQVKEVVVEALANKMEIWDKDRYQQSVATIDKKKILELLNSIM